MMNLFRRQEFSYQIHVVRYRIKCQQMLLNVLITKAIAKSETSRSKKGPYLYLTDAQRYEVGLLPLEQLMRYDTTLIIILTFH